MTLSLKFLNNKLTERQKKKEKRKLKQTSIDRNEIEKRSNETEIRLTQTSQRSNHSVKELHQKAAHCFERLKMTCS